VLYNKVIAGTGYIPALIKKIAGKFTGVESDSRRAAEGVKREGYRADIDGIRAIAVLLVLFFHGGNTWFTSGFVGVDVFFVISGYLITSIVLKDLSEGKFSFARFYSGRIWRLQPALILIYIATAIIAICIYLPDDFVDYLKSAKYATMLLSNQYFERVTTAYAADDTSALLLLHTWSLAIEWQWYLLLPLCIVLMHRSFSMRTVRFVIVAATLVAIISAMFLSVQQPDKSYYFLLSRIFELLVGSSVVVLGHDKAQLGRLPASLIGIASSVVIIYCSTRTDILRGFPDYHALLVCLATAALLTPSVGRAGLHSRLLGAWLPRSIGKISYSLYLWHWPVLAVIAYLGLRGNAGSDIGYYALSFALAVVSYKMIEQPFRKVRLKFALSASLLIIVPALVFSGGYKLSVKHDGWPLRLGSEYAAIQNNLKDFDTTHRRDCIDEMPNGDDPRCVVGNAVAPVKALMIGDSFSNQYMGFMDVIGRSAGVSVTALSTSACLALPDIYLYDWWKFKDKLYQTCHDNAVAYYEMIKKNRYQYVILGQVWDNYAGGSVVTSMTDERSVELSRKRVEDAMRHALKIIVDSGARPVIIKAVQTMPSAINECLSMRFKMRGELGSVAKSQQCSQTKQSPKESEWFETLFAALHKEFPSLVFIDPKDVQCNKGVCATTIDSVPVYRDVGHITDYASFKFAEQYVKRYGNPLM